MIHNQICLIIVSGFVVIEMDFLFRLLHREPTRRGAFDREKPAAITARLGFDN